jgi:hypothetical protein
VKVVRERQRASENVGQSNINVTFFLFLKEKIKKKLKKRRKKKKKKKTTRAARQCPQTAG